MLRFTHTILHDNCRFYSARSNQGRFDRICCSASLAASFSGAIARKNRPLVQRSGIQEWLPPSSFISEFSIIGFAITAKRYNQWLSMIRENHLVAGWCEGHYVCAELSGRMIIGQIILHIRLRAIKQIIQQTIDQNYVNSFSMKTVSQSVVLDSLIRRLESLTPQTSRKWGTMSPNEMLCHLGDSAEVVLANGWENNVRSESLPPEFRPPKKPPIPFAKFFALKMPLPWPHNLKTDPRVDPKQYGSPPEEFEADRQRAIDGLKKLAAAENLPQVHPMIGTMTLEEWKRWAWLHTDHHLRQFGV